MATLYISEFGGISSIGSNQAQVLPQPATADQTVAIAGASARSAAFNARTKAVLLSADSVCSIKFGDTSVVATAGNFRLSADTPIPFSVEPGGFVAVISNT